MVVTLDLAELGFGEDAAAAKQRDSSAHVDKLIAKTERTGINTKSEWVSEWVSESEREVAPVAEIDGAAVARGGGEKARPKVWVYRGENFYWGCVRIEYLKQRRFG